MSRVALLSDDLDIERRLLHALGADRFAELVSTHADLIGLAPDAAVCALGGLNLDVVVIGPRTDPLTALSVAEVLDATRPEVTTLIIAEQSPELWELAMHAGIRAVLPPDIDPVPLRDAIERALEVAERRRAMAITIDLRQMPESPPPTSRIITVIAPKGGSGKTTTSTNLAAGLAALVPDGVAIVDLDLQFGDVADALHLEPEYTIGDIRGRADHLDSAELKMLLTRHDCGVFALCAPDDPAAGEEMRSEDVAAALTVLAADLPYVVVDTAAGIDEASLTAIEMSTDLVLVASLDVPSVRNLRKLITALDRLGITQPTRHLVLNRAGSKVGIAVSDVEATLGLRVSVAIPSGRAITISTNEGTPIIVGDPSSPLARPFNDLVALFTDVPAARAGGFARFRRSAR